MMEGPGRTPTYSPNSSANQIHASGNSSAPPMIKRLATSFAADGAARHAITRYAKATSSDSVREDKTLRIQSGIRLFWLSDLDR